MHRSETPTGKFAGKHPSGTRVPEAVDAALKEERRHGTISCAAAHRIAGRLAVPPATVGVGIDLLDASIVRCQLGLFGYAPNKKIVEPDPSPDPEIEAEIRARSVEGALPCADAWDIADERGLPRMTVSSVCETLGIRVRPCQLGAF